MNWFKRKEQAIQTATEEKREAPDGIWYRTPSGNVVHMRELEAHAFVCPADNHHVRIGSKEYFDILFDEKKCVELDKGISAADPLNFIDTKPYKQRIQQAQKTTNLEDAVRTARGKIEGREFIVSCMDFKFVGGSMGAVVGEKIYRAAGHALKRRSPLFIVCKSGGARMMEAGFSLMQMPKIISQLIRLERKRIPYLTLLTDPTTGGVSASFGMLGDFNLAEPEALIAFAGPRVIRETIGQDLPKGFQRAEFLLEHGFIDKIVDRRQLKETLAQLVRLLET